MAKGDCNKLLEFLVCEPLDTNLFRGQSRDFKTGQVFGGQVLGQAIKAAYQTVEDGRRIHSAHAYFLTRGDVNAPIIYEVDRSLDGGTFSSRRVVAIQHGQQIFHLSASFQRHEEGLEYHRSWMLPKDALDEAVERALPSDHPFQGEFFDIHFIPREQSSEPDTVQFWVKSKQALPDTFQCHHSALAYFSDMGLLYSTLVPHFGDLKGLANSGKDIVVASLDHAIWYHRPFRVDDWLFYTCKAQSTSNSRGLGFGRIYSKDGTLVASTSQEGLIRQKRQ